MTRPPIFGPTGSIFISHSHWPKHKKNRFTLPPVGLWLPGILLIALQAGCHFGSSGLDGCSDVEVAVNPQYICPGEPVRIRWSTDPRFIPCGSFGTACRGLIPERITAIINSYSAAFDTAPERLFDGSTGLIRVEPAGAVTVYPFQDGSIRVSIFRDGGASGVFFCDNDRMEIQVLDPERDEIDYHSMAFVFGCTAEADGSAGWGAINIERGQLASPSVHIQNVYNMSPFAILLTVRRDTEDLSIPPVVTVILEAQGRPGDHTTEIDNEFFGLWAAAPLEPDAFGPTGCDSATPMGSVDLPPAGDGPVIVAQPNIFIDVGLGCARVPTSLEEETLTELPHESVFDDPGVGEDAGLTDLDETPPIPGDEAPGNHDTGVEPLDPERVDAPEDVNAIPGAPQIPDGINDDDGPNVAPNLDPNAQSADMRHLNAGIVLCRLSARTISVPPQS